MFSAFKKRSQLKCIHKRPGQTKHAVKEHAVGTHTLSLKIGVGAEEIKSKKNLKRHFLSKKAQLARRSMER